MTMTNPPPPPASAMGLVAEWLQRPDHYDVNENRDWFTWLARAGCAHELAAALSLSEEEREALARMDEASLTYGGSLSIDKRPLYSMIVTIADYDTLRALIARVTAQESP